MKQSYLSFDFANFDAKGLKPIVSAFGRSKLPVLKDEKGVPKIEATNRIKRIKGFPTKTATFYFVDGQSLTISATSEGSIYQVKLNKLVVPVKNVDDLSAAVKELAAMIKKNSAKFEEKLAKQAIRKHSEEPKVKRGSNGIPARLKASKGKVEELRTLISNKQRLVESSNRILSDNTSSISTLESSIENERSRRERLSTQLEQALAA